MSAAVATSAAEVQEAVCEGAPLIPVAGGTHTAAIPDLDGPVGALDVGGLAGIVDYDPAELTFTARPGTPLAEIDAMLAAQGQHLPFDPPRLGDGATLGGAVAAGVTGPGGFAAGIRDFVVGVRFVDGSGRLAMGGGKVVKNAAGFDLPKLMVGSLGRLGVIVELSLKVFPRPATTATVRFPAGDLETGLATVATLARGPVPVSALDLDPDGAVTARIGGDAALIDVRAVRLARSVEPAGEPLVGDAEVALWDLAHRFAWVPPDARLVVVPLGPRRVPALDRELGRRGVDRRYGLAANVAWIAWPRADRLADLSELLAVQALSGVALTGESLAEPLLGSVTGGDFGRRVTRALDSAGAFAGGAR